VLTKEAIGSATSFGREMRVHGNELIFARGDRSVDLFLVLDCEIVIYESGPEGKECEVASVRSGQFTDELDYSAKSHSIYFRATFGRQRAVVLPSPPALLTKYFEIARDSQAEHCPVSLRT